MASRPYEVDFMFLEETFGTQPVGSARTRCDKYYSFSATCFSAYRRSDVGEVRRELRLQGQGEALRRGVSEVHQQDLGGDFGEVRAEIQRPLHLLIHQAFGPDPAQRPAEEQQQPGAQARRHPSSLHVWILILPILLGGKI